MTFTTRRATTKLLTKRYGSFDFTLHKIIKLTSPTNNKQTDTFSSMGSQLKGSATRLGRMAASGNKVAILKLSGILIGSFLVIYYLYRLFVG